jgi:hypothetical protein
MCKNRNTCSIQYSLSTTALSNGANVFCFLSSLPLLPPSITAAIGSYLSSLYSSLTLYRRCRLAYPYDWRGFVGATTEDARGPLSMLFIEGFEFRLRDNLGISPLTPTGGLLFT